jgi:EAL domain-containing protein (putative c-di-GMP-specific phosphodiesterase class I)
MYIIGIFIYMSAALFLMMFDAGRVFFSTTFSLAPEILTLIVISYFYPMLVFILAYLSNQQKITKSFFQSQVILASTLCVSLGLIGTFLGLSEMVSSISSGMNAEGDFNVKIASLLNSIGSSLDAMSLAFLTSIMGVSASVIILVSCNYIALYFKDEALKVSSIKGPNFTNSTSSCINLDDIDRELNNSLSSEIFSSLSVYLKKNNESQEKLYKNLDVFMSKQTHILNAGFDVISKSSEKIIEQMSISNNNLSSIHKILENTDSKFNKSAKEFNNNLGKISAFSCEITSEIKDTAAMLESAQVVLDSIVNKLVDITIGVNQGFEESNSYSNKIVAEVSSSNEKLKDISHQFESFDKSYQNKIADFNTQLDNNSHELKSYISVMKDLKILLAPPLNEVLSLAITENTLDLTFQPNTDKHENVIGCEVLLRWDDLLRGTVSNADVFSLEMQSNNTLMINLDKWVLNSSIRQLASWIKKDVWKKNSIMSINISQSMLTDFSLIPFLNKVINKNMIPASNIAIEFNESIVLNTDFEFIKQICNDIRTLGCKIFIDNYGPGNSSVIMYQQLCVDKLKIDRSIISILQDENESGSIVRSIIASSKELGIELIAEAVEDEIQKSRLTEFGVNIFQGYLLSPPLNSADYQAFINTNS